ncbi:class I SAM-dependent methyltransferase [Sulfobacillus thermosulfidooxidans]|uniref:class I SAM-dependent methyltransferase n=1 Tax=Sulfobacillus thermosulfidooxidans TaxID=28034 RepID=UPI0006B5ECEB|nr:class I SAM-dependent methyltransferase [Sulfobacillus thermosulfidooxidans]
MSSSDELVQKYFGRYHEAYRNSAPHAHGHDLTHLIEMLHLTPNSLVLDAACGTGHTALALARQGHRVIGLDVTQEMLAEAESLAQQNHLEIQWVQGTVHHLPWEDNTFDAITCRRAAHHFSDLARFLEEARRVLKPGTFLAISDMTAPSDAIDWLNQLERYRDASHEAARSANEWARLITEAGFDLMTLGVSVEVMTAEQWLAPVPADSEEGQQAMQFLTYHPPSTIFSHNQFHKYRLIMAVMKPLPSWD